MFPDGPFLRDGSQLERELLFMQIVSLKKFRYFQ